MTIYTVHTTPGGNDRSVRLVPHRFGWSAFFFGPFWLLAKRLWLAAALVFVIDGVAVAAVQAGMLNAGAALAITGLMAMLVGLEGREWTRRSLSSGGSTFRGVAFGASEAEALAWAASRQSVSESQT